VLRYLGGEFTTPDFDAAIPSEPGARG
jgi:hypothetical protein